MKKNYVKLLKSYKKLEQKDKIKFQNTINRENELEQLSIRASVANQIMGSLSNPDGTSYFNPDWVAKNIMKMSDEEIQINKSLNNGEIKFGKKITK